MRVAQSFAIIFFTYLAGCTAAMESQFTLFAEPGQYDFYDCRQLGTERTVKKRKEQELKLLMDKAEQGTGGAFVNVIAYKADYVQVQEQLKTIETTARTKNCSSPENWQSNSAFR
jgi:hypothetical protein